MNQKRLMAFYAADGERTLCFVRHLDEEEQKQWREGIFFKVNSDVEYVIQSHFSVVPFPQRTPDGSLPGGSNRIWLISQDEWDEIVAKDQAYQQQKQQKEVAVPVPPPMSEEVKALFKQYGSSERAWDDGNERACFLMRPYEK